MGHLTAMSKNSSSLMLRLRQALRRTWLLAIVLGFGLNICGYATASASDACAGLYDGDTSGVSQSKLFACQKQLYSSGVLDFDVSPGTGSCSEDASITTNLKGNLTPNVKTAFAFFVSKSYTAQQSAGIVGNLMQESGLDPTSTNSIGAHGIAQWLGDRLTAERLWAAAHGEKPDNLLTQLNYVVHELDTSESAAKASLKKQHTVNGATGSIFTYYERAGDDSLPDRQNNAQLVFSKLSGQVDATSIDTTSSGSCAGEPGGSTVDCSTAKGNENILCQAKAYNGIYYRWGGGHQGYDAFIKGCPDPSNPPNNHPHGAPNDPTNGGLSGNPSPCATDCSSLVSIAVDAAFNQKFMWTVSTLQSSSQWKKISISDIKPGDVLTRGSYHIEIVDHYMGGSNVFTFGSHETGTRTSLISQPLSSWAAAYRYIGPGV